MKSTLDQERRFAGWNVNLSIGFCRHESGALVYFDPKLTESGGIRCVGPFLHQACDPIENVLSALVCHLETELAPGYVIWGGYQDSASPAGPSISVLGVRCGFVPKLSIRGSFLHKLRDLAREWVIVDGDVYHRSGIDLGQNRDAVSLDKLVVHPMTAQDDVSVLRQMKPLITNYLKTSKVVGLIR